MLRTIVSGERACPLPAAVERELTQLEGRHGQRADWQAQHRLAGLDEAAAVRVLQKIGESQQPVQNLSAYIQYMATNYDASQDAACRSVPSKRDFQCSMDSQDGSDCVKGKDNTPSSDEDVFDTDKETIVLEAMNTIVQRSLKRARRPGKMPKAKRLKVVRDRRQGRHMPDKDVSVPKSRYNSSYVIEILKELDEDQKIYLKDIGFGGILHLDCGPVPRSFVQWLGDHVDVKKEEMIFNNRSIELSDQSFGHVLGIPTSGIPVPSDSKAATLEFLQSFGLSEMPSIKFFGDKILNKGQNKTEFIRCFMAVALSSFYCPTSNTKPSTAYIAGLIDVDNINSYNWGKFIKDHNLWYINKYQKFSSTLAVCNYYMSVRYLDFLDYGAVLIQPTLPRISVWKGDMIKEYINLDTDDDNYYGKLAIKDIAETCYAQANLKNANQNTFSSQNLRDSIISFQHPAFTDKVQDSMCKLFDDYMQEEAPGDSGKVGELLVSFLQCLLENKCISSSSQSTEKIICSSQNENTSSGTNNQSNSTIKLPSNETSRNIGVSDIGFSSQNSDNSEPVAKKKEQELKIVEENVNPDIASTEEIIARLVEPTTSIVGMNSNMPTNSEMDVQVDVGDGQINHVNTELCNLQIQEKKKQDNKSHQQNKDMLDLSTSSASLQHMLVDNTTTVHCEVNKSKEVGLQESENMNNQEIDIDIRTPVKTHDMFAGVNNMDLEKSSKYTNSSSINCAQRTHMSDNEKIQGINLDTKFLEQSSTEELSSETRINSYWSFRENESLENMNVCDFEFDDGQPSIPLMVRLRTSPRNQVIRSMKAKELEQTEMQHTPDKNSNTNTSSNNSPQRTNVLQVADKPIQPIVIGSTDSPARKPLKDIFYISSQGSSEEPLLRDRQLSPTRRSHINISSQESPEMPSTRDRQQSPTRSNHVDISSQESPHRSQRDETESVYIGEHRLSPINNRTSEPIDSLYDEENYANQSNYATSSSTTQFTKSLPPRRMVPPSRYVSSPYDVPVRSYTPTAKQIEYYQAIVRLANMDEYKFHMGIQIGNCKVTMETFGNSLKPGGVVEGWVINLYCRILFKNIHPKESNRHTFFHTPSEYFLEKWETGDRMLVLKDQTLKSFEGAGKAKKLHLTESLHFPSLYNFHWFLFTVNIRDKKFMFLDSLLGKDSEMHKEVDNRMVKNFIEIWNECSLKPINFNEFEIVHPPVPKQINGKDCGICLMKNIEFFKPRSMLMGTYSHQDIPNIRVQIANEMMFCPYNESSKIQDAVRQFKPAVHGRYARMM